MEKKIVNLTLGGRGFYFFFKKKSNRNKFLCRNNTFKPLTHPHTLPHPSERKQNTSSQ